MPFDVEELRVRAAAAPLEYVQPPGVARATYRHVVGDDIEDEPHALAAQGLHQTLQRRFAAQFRVDAGRVDHVVTVHGAGAGGQQGRGINVADAAFREVVDQRSSVVEGEVAVKLTTQGGG